MKKYLALALALLMIAALCAGCGDKTETAAATEAPAAETTTAPAADAEAPTAAAAAPADDWSTYLDYVSAYAAAGAPTEDEATAVTDSIKACTSVDELNAIPQMTVIFENTGVLTYDAWVAAGRPEADTSGVTGEAGAKASGTPSGDKASGAPSGDKTSGAPSGGGGATLVEPDYTKYSKDFKGYKQYCIDAFATDEHAPTDLKESTNAGLEAAVDENDSTIGMLVDVGLVVDYATFIAG